MGQLLEKIIRQNRLLHLIFLVAVVSALFLVNGTSADALDICTVDSNCADWQYCIAPNCVDVLSCSGPRYADVVCSGDTEFECGAGKYCGAAMGTLIKYHKCMGVTNYPTCLDCAYPTLDCNSNGGCEVNAATDLNNCGTCGNDCTTKEAECVGDVKYQYTGSCSGGSCNIESLGCQKECCIQVGDVCNTDGVCAPPSPKCIDFDGDGYYGKTADCQSGTDCNDNNNAVWELNSCGVCAAEPAGIGQSCTAGIGECQSLGTYVCDVAGTGTACNAVAGTPTAEICGNGMDEDCNGADLRCPTCGNYVTDAGEACDYTSQLTGTKTQTCTGGYPSVTLTCNEYCTGYDGGCGSCGDGTVNGPEQCEVGQARTYTCPSGKTLPQPCTNSCTWAAISPSDCVSCSNGIKDGTETGVDCGGSCTPCVSCNSAPVVSLAPASWSTTAGTAASQTFTISVRNNDPSACAASTYALSLSCPAGLSCGALSKMSLSIAPQVNDATASFVVNVGASVPAGSYVVSVSAVNAVSADSASGTATVTVAAAASTPCGNGVIDAGEACDGANLIGQTCVSQGYLRGDLKCSADCTWLDVSGCSDTPCPLTYPSQQCGKLNPVRTESFFDFSGVLNPFWIIDEEIYYTTRYVSAPILRPTYMKKAGLNGGFSAVAHFGNQTVVETPVSALKFNEDLFVLSQVYHYNTRGGYDFYSNIYLVKDERDSTGFNVFSKIFDGEKEPVLTLPTSITAGGAFLYHRGAMAKKLLVAGGKLYSIHKGYPDDLNIYRYNEGRFEHFTSSPGVVGVIDAVSLNDKIYILTQGPEYDKTSSCGDLSKPYSKRDIELRVFDGSSVSLVSKSTQMMLWLGYLEDGSCSVSGFSDPDPQALVALNGKLYASQLSNTYSAIGFKALMYNSADWSVAATYSKTFQLRGAYSYILNPSVVGGKAYFPITVTGYGGGYGYGLLSFDGTAFSFEPYSDVPGGYAALNDCGQSVLFGPSAASSNAVYVSSAIGSNVFPSYNAFSWISMLAFGIDGEDRVCCEGKGEEWLKSGEKDKPVDGQFTDVRGERKAPASVRLLPNQPVCSDKFFKRTRDCVTDKCLSSTVDNAACDKASDCVYDGRCYSDVKLVAATYFGDDTSQVLNSVWKDEVSVDVDGDGVKDMMCDPGEWVDIGSSVFGAVTGKTSGLPLGGAVVSADSTNKMYRYATVAGADGSYAIATVEAMNYDLTASKAGYVTGFYNNVPVQPSKNVQVDFQLDRATSTVSGYVTNISPEPNNAVASAIVKVVGTAFGAVTDAAGRYTILDVPQDTYDLVATKVSDGYQNAVKLSVPLLESTASVNFTLLKALGSCNSDCTVGSSNVCDASCNGKGSCWFASDATMQACDGTFGLVMMPDGKYVECCMGNPYAPLKANMQVPSDNVIVTKIPVLFKGKFVNMVIAVFNK